MMNAKMLPLAVATALLGLATACSRQTTTNPEPTPTTTSTPAQVTTPDTEEGVEPDFEILDHDEQFVVDNGPLKLRRGTWKKKDDFTWTRNFTKFDHLALYLMPDGAPSVAVSEHLTPSDPFFVYVRGDASTPTEDTLTFTPSEETLTLKTTKIQFGRSGDWLKPKGNEKFRIKKIKGRLANAKGDLDDTCGDPDKDPNAGCDKKYKKKVSITLNPLPES